MAHLELPVINGWRPFWQRHGGHVENDTEPGTYYVEAEQQMNLENEIDFDYNPEHGQVPITQVWFETPPLTQSDIDQLTTLQLITESHTERLTPHDTWAGSWTWFQLAIRGNNANDRKLLPNGQWLEWHSHSNWFKTVNNSNEWCRGQMFTKDDEIFKHLKAGSIISVWMSAGAGRANHANRAYLAFGFGCGPKMYRTPKLRPNGAPLISVYAQKRQECLMMPENDFWTDVKANIVQGGVDLMGRLLGTKDNDWTVECHSLGPVNQVAAHPAGLVAPGSLTFDSVIELANGPKAAPLQVVKESTVVGRLGPNTAAQPQGNSKIIVWDDSDVNKSHGGNDILDSQGVLPPLDLNNEKPRKKVLIYQMHAPLWFGTLWDKVIENVERDDLTIIIVINADDLRADEIRISRGISWEKTMEDFDQRVDKIYGKMAEKMAERIRNDPEKYEKYEEERKLDIVQKKVHLLVRCGYEGVLHVPPCPEGQPTKDQPAKDQRAQNQPVTDPPSQDKPVEYNPSDDQPPDRYQPDEKLPVKKQPDKKLSDRDQPDRDQPTGYKRPFVFHMVPNMAEGDFLRHCHGRMPGIHLAFVTGLAASLARHPDISPQALGRTQIGASIQLAIIWSHRFVSAGFFKDPNGTLNYPKAKNINHFQAAKIKVIYGDRRLIRPHGKWSLFNLLYTQQDSVAAQIVKLGTKRIEASVPTARFGSVQSADRIEIEGYRSTAAVVHEYLRGKAPRPLSIAVFGQPGAGKSFGVKQVIKAVLKDCGKDCNPIEANLSQFLEYSDLVGVFHKVRDTALRGELPVVLFDEFDSALGEKALGWLKYFLAPMQDAEFLDSSSIRPLGRAIFIFIGGTSYTFDEFAGQVLPNQLVPPAGWVPPFRTEREKMAKKPDFVSRLSAHIDVRGPNPNRNGEDVMFTMRRAILLQGLLERRYGAEVKDIKVQDTVIKALLKHRKFPHGTRSLELILQMSRLSGRRRFESSDLPSDDQLVMHVGDVAAFSRLLDGPTIDMAKIRPIDVRLNNQWMWARMLQKDED